MSFFGLMLDLMPSDIVGLSKLLLLLLLVLLVLATRFGWYGVVELLQIPLKLVFGVPVTILAILFCCRKLFRFMKYRRQLATWSRTESIQLTVTSMSGCTVSLNANETWRILEVKQALAGLNVAPVNQIRLLNGTSEMKDNDLVSASGTAEFSLLIRSKLYGEWLDSLDQVGESVLQDFPEEIRSSKECAIAAFRRFEFKAVQRFPAFQDDIDAMTAAISHDGFSFFFASPRLRTDPALALMAISRDRQALAAAWEPLRSDSCFLSRAYWASCLDNRERLPEGARQSDEWENVLYQRCGTVSRRIWSMVQRMLRFKDFRREFYGTTYMCVWLITMILGLTDLFKPIFWWWSGKDGPFLFNMALAFLIGHGFSSVLNDMQAEIRAFMVGRLEKSCRSTYASSIESSEFGRLESQSLL